MIYSSRSNADRTPLRCYLRCVRVRCPTPHHPPPKHPTCLCVRCCAPNSIEHSPLCPFISTPTQCTPTTRFSQPPESPTSRPIQPHSLGVFFGCYCFCLGFLDNVFVRFIL